MFITYLYSCSPENAVAQSVSMQAHPRAHPQARKDTHVSAGTHSYSRGQGPADSVHLQKQREYSRQGNCWGNNWIRLANGMTHTWELHGLPWKLHVLSTCHGAGRHFKIFPVSQCCWEGWLPFPVAASSFSQPILLFNSGPLHTCLSRTEPGLNGKKRAVKMGSVTENRHLQGQRGELRQGQMHSKSVDG